MKALTSANSYQDEIRGCGTNLFAIVLVFGSPWKAAQRVR